VSRGFIAEIMRDESFCNGNRSCLDHYAERLQEPEVCTRAYRKDQVDFYPQCLIKAGGGPLLDEVCKDGFSGNFALSRLLRSGCLSYLTTDNVGQYTPNEYEWFSVMATFGDNQVIVTRLHELRFDPNRKLRGDTAIMYLAKQKTGKDIRGDNHEKPQEMPNLISFGVDPRIPDKLGRLAIDYAFENARVDDYIALKAAAFPEHAVTERNLQNLAANCKVAGGGKEYCAMNFFMPEKINRLIDLRLVGEFFWD